MNNEVLINKEDLETIDNNMTYLSDNLDIVTNNINQMEGRLNQVSSEFSSLQNNLKKTVMETQRTTLVLNAKQTIMLLRQEYDRKYRYRDDIRRKVKGLIQAGDINKLRKSTLEMIGEEAIVNSPDYWLTPALLALCSWYLSDKESAHNYLQEALKRDAETTSLLLCLIHIRAARYQTATKWLTRYLGMQTPTSIDGKIAIVFEAITQGIFNQEMQELCLSRFEEWQTVLNENASYKSKQLEKWQQKFQTYHQGISDKNPYTNKFIQEKDVINNQDLQLSALEIIKEDFQNIINKPVLKIENTSTIIDRLLDILIYNCDKEEWQLHNSLAMNEYIVKCDGNVDKAIKKYENTQDILNQYHDFYTHITNIALNNTEQEYSPNTIKMAMAFSKELIISAYQTITIFNKNEPKTFTIKIEEYTGTTENGSNERELVSDVMKFIDNKYHHEIYTPKLINFKNILTFILAVLLIIFCNKYVLVLVIGLLPIAGYNLFTIYKVYQERKRKLGQLANIKKDYIIILLNVLAEIVDAHFNYQDKFKEYQEFLAYLQNLNYRDYFTKTSDNNYRNILKEGKNNE